MSRLQAAWVHRTFEASVLLILFSISLVTDARAANFTLEQVMSSPFPSGLVSALHADRVAWVFTAKGVRNVWVADGPEFAARQVTHYSTDDGQPIASLRITSDGRTVVYARGSETNETGRVADPTSTVSSRKQQVWAVDIDGEPPRFLGDMGCGEEDCEDIQLSPDGKFAVWAAKKQLWIAPVSAVTAAHQFTDLSGENLSPKWSPDGRQIVFVSKRNDHSFIAVYEFGKDGVHYLAPATDRDILPRWSLDGRRIIFIRTPGVEQKLPLIPVRTIPWSIWIADAKTAEASQIWHSGTQPNDSFPEPTANGSFKYGTNDRILFASEQDGRNHLYSMPAAGGAPVLLTPGQFDVEDAVLSADYRTVIYTSNQDDIDRRHVWRVPLEGGTPQPVTKGATIEWSPVETGEGQNLLCLGSSATSPAMPYRITAQGRTMLASASLPAAFPSKQLIIPKQVVFKSEDGFDIHGQLFVPNERSGSGPALIFMHGGPVRQMLLGFHYGYLTALGLARNSDLFAAGSDMHGVHDWSEFLPHWENRPGAPDAAEAAKLAFESSPDASVSHWKSPVLLIHGDDDRNVPFSQTADLAQRLRENHVEFEELIFPDEIHDFLLWRNWIRAYGATADFFDRKLKGSGSHVQ